MKEIFFKVTIASIMNLPLSTKDIRKFPSHEMYIAEYDEKLINVMYKPAKGFSVEGFKKLMISKLQSIYNTPLVEILEKQNAINQ